jgi:hypothetical protein
MVTKTGALRPEDGAKFYARLVPGSWNQMILKMEVRLDGHHTEQLEDQRVINDRMEARRIGNQFAQDWGQSSGAIWDQE